MRTLKNSVVIAVWCITAFAFIAGAQSVKPAAPKAKAVKKGDVYSVVDTVPAFPGGIPAFGKYLATTVKYPAADRQSKTQGKVFVSFIVEADGRVSNVEALRGPSETLKAEAVRALEESPKWVPGKQKGKAVRVQYTVPVNFALGD